MLPLMDLHRIFMDLGSGAMFHGCPGTRQVDISSLDVHFILSLLILAVGSACHPGYGHKSDLQRTP